jgi:hypothetical protein
MEIKGTTLAITGLGIPEGYCYAFPVICKDLNLRLLKTYFLVTL